MTYDIPKEKMATLLERSLSDTEIADYDNLLTTAKSQLERLLGIKIDGDSDTARVYASRPIYSQLWTDPFTGTPTVSVVNADSTTVLSGTPAYFDDLNSDWFNSIILDRPMGEKRITVTANWGFGENLPGDLQKLWAGLFDLQSAPITEVTGAITSEQILTHKVTYADASSDSYDQWIQNNATIIARYAKPASTVYGGFHEIPRFD